MGSHEGPFSREHDAEVRNEHSLIMSNASAAIIRYQGRRRSILLKARGGLYRFVRGYRRELGAFSARPAWGPRLHQ